MLGRSVDQTCKDLNEQSEIPVQILAIPGGTEDQMFLAETNLTGNLDVTNGGRCQFPSWLQTAIDEWTSLDGRHHYTFSSSKWLQKDDNQIQIMMECVEHLEDLGHLQQYIVTRTHDW